MTQISDNDADSVEDMADALDATMGQADIAAAAPSAPVPPLDAEERPGCMRRWGGRIVRTFIGVVACGFPVLAVLALGWTLRLMQRVTLRHWWSRRRQLDPHGALSGPLPALPDLGTWLGRHPGLHASVQTPHWSSADRACAGVKAMPEAPPWRWPDHAVRLVFGSLWQNLGRGLGGLVGVFAITLPTGLLWATAWYAGWDTSFYKVYEQHDRGVQIAVLGFLAFMPAMLYLPFAQAHQAASGDWTAFFQVGVIRRLIWRRAGSTLWLAVAFALVAIPVNVMLVWPLFMSNMHPEYADLSREAIVQILRGHGFRTALLGFPAYLLLRLLAARLYAGALLELIAKEPATVDLLPTTLRAALGDLGHLPAPDAKGTRHSIPLRSLAGGFRLACLGLAALVWVGFGAQIYVVEFFNYHGPRAWLNQPLIQLPYFTYIPPVLEVR